MTGTSRIGLILGFVAVFAHEVLEFVGRTGVFDMQGQQVGYVRSQ